jgi:hypothetical protein
MDILDDPYRVYSDMRRHVPICRDDTRGIWVLTRYRDVALALKDPRLSSGIGPSGSKDATDDASGNDLTGLFSNQVELCDPPTHSRLRKLVSRAFKRLDLSAIETYTECAAARLVDAMVTAGGGDVMNDLASPLTYEIILEVLGIRPALRREFAGYVGALLDNFTRTGNDAQAFDETSKVADALVELVGREAAEPGGAGRLLHLLRLVEVKGDRLSLKEWAANVILIFAAGQGTTANLIGNGLMMLLQHPAHMRTLRADRRRLANSIEEMLRYDSPIQSVSRIALDEIPLHGQRLRRGDTVSLVLASANRDESIFPTAECPVMQRQPNRHLAFGAGIHFCVGAQLARMQARVAINALLAKTANIVLEEQALSWHPGPSYRGVVALRVRFE